MAKGVINISITLLSGEWCQCSYTREVRVIEVRKESNLSLNCRRLKLEHPRKAHKNIRNY